MTRPTPALRASRTGRLAPIRARVAVPRRWPAQLPALLLAFAFACAGLAPRAAAQCSMCKDGVYSQADSSRNNVLGTAFNDNVVFMLAVPGLLMGGLALVIALNVRARARSEAAALTSAAPANLHHATPPDATPPTR